MSCEKVKVTSKNTEKPSTLGKNERLHDGKAFKCIGAFLIQARLELDEFRHFILYFVRNSRECWIRPIFSNYKDLNRHGSLGEF